MLDLMNLSKADSTVNATYDVVHNTEQFRTTLRQKLYVTICERTGAVKGALHVTDLEAESMPEALSQLALWCERLAEALREPMTVTASVPIFERDYATSVQIPQAEDGGLALERLKALANGKGIGSAEALLAAQQLYEMCYITYPMSTMRYLPGNREHEVPDILANIENVFPGISKDAHFRADAPVFMSSFPYAHHAIIPTLERPRDAAQFFALSETARTVYRIVAEEYVRAICEVPAGQSASGEGDA